MNQIEKGDIAAFSIKRDNYPPNNIGEVLIIERMGYSSEAHTMYMVRVQHNGMMTAALGSELTLVRKNNFPKDED